MLGKSKYKIIYADPPWTYWAWSEDKKPAAGVAKRHYNTMRLEDICNMPVNDIADRDCKLFLWATPPCLPQALEVIKRWGFEYKTIAFVWIKTNRRSKTPFFGIGHWTASNCELLLAGLKKGGRLRRQDKSISQVVLAPREAHSKKPDVIRDKIVQLCGDVPRIELFARSRTTLFGKNTAGWDVWGDEAKCLNAEVIARA